MLAAHTHWIAGQAAQLSANYGVAVARFRRARTVAKDEGDIRDALWGLMITSILSEMHSAHEVALELQRRRDASPVDLLVATNAALLARRYTSGFADPLDVDSALHHLEAASNPRLCTSFMYSLSYEKLLRGDYEGAHRLSALTLEQALKYQLSWVLPHAEWVLAASSVGIRDFTQASRRLWRLERTADRLDDTLVRLNTAALRARLHLALQRPEEAHEALEVDDSGAVNAAMRAELTAMRALVFALQGDIATSGTRSLQGSGYEHFGRSPRLRGVRPRSLPTGRCDRCDRANDGSATGRLGSSRFDYAGPSDSAGGTR